jgi:hypothetical protein
MQSASRWPANSAQPPSAPSRMLLRLANKGSLRNEALLTKPDTSPLGSMSTERNRPERQRSELISNSLNDARSSQSLSQRTTRIRRLAAKVRLTRLTQ